MPHQLGTLHQFLLKQSDTSFEICIHDAKSPAQLVNILMNNKRREMNIMHKKEKHYKFISHCQEGSRSLHTPTGSMRHGNEGEITNQIMYRCVYLYKFIPFHQIDKFHISRFHSPFCVNKKAYSL